MVYKFISDIKEIVRSAGLEANNATPKTETSAKTDPKDSDSQNLDSDADERIKRLPQVICIGAKKCGTGYGLVKSVTSKYIRNSDKIICEFLPFLLKYKSHRPRYKLYYIVHMIWAVHMYGPHGPYVRTTWTVHDGPHV